MKSSQSCGYTHTLSCSHLKPIAWSVFRTLSRNSFCFSGMSKISTRHLPSHFFGQGILYSHFFHSHNFSFPFEVNARKLVFQRIRPFFASRSRAARTERYFFFCSAWSIILYI